MKATITVKMHTAAFAHSSASELARILIDLAYQIKEEGPDFVTIRDVNGNTVGEFRISRN
jgi:hypothetical protein